MPDRWLIRDVQSIVPRLDRVGLSFKVSNPRLVLAVFYDLHCPGCALLETEAGDYLMSLVEKGVVNLYYVDYPVHRGIERMHAAVRCIYRNDPVTFRAVLRRLYEALMKGDEPRSVGEDHGSCVDKELPMVSEGKALAKELKIPGTPGIIVGNLQRNMGYGIFGYPGLGKLMEIIEDMYV
jgi:protein-disulfide isomerase